VSRLKVKWGIVGKAALIVAPLIVIKALLHLFNLEMISVGPIITALVAGVFFVLAIILSGVLQDFKESEKMPGELAASIEALYKDSKLIGNGAESNAMIDHIKELLHALHANFERKGNWKLSEVNGVIDKIDNNIKSFAETGAPMPLLLKMRNELGNIKRMSNRVEIIKEKSFIPGAYAVAELATGGAIAVLILSKIDPYIEGLVLVGVLALILISVVLLIKDMDNPFEGYARVDWSQLYKLEKYMDSQ
jgi:hypothetical protein